MKYSLRTSTDTYLPLCTHDWIVNIFYHKIILLWFRERVEKSFVEEDRIQDLPSFIPYNLLTQHSIPDKSIADCVEALIG